MKNKRLLLSSILAASVFTSVPAIAASPDFNLVSASYDTVEADGMTPSGFSFLGTHLLNENVFLAASYASLSDDLKFCFGACAKIEVTTNQLNLGVGYRYGLNSTTDVYAAGYYVNLEIEASYDGESDSESEGGYGAEIGIRLMLTDSVEAFANVNYAKVEELTDDFVTAGAFYSVNEVFALGASYRLSDGYSISARYYF